MIKRERFKIKHVFVLIFLLGTISNCDSGDINMKRQIEAYRGDGVIRYLDKPSILGRSGVLVDFPLFNLTNNFKTQYNINGLPDGKGYIIYFIPSNSVNKNALNKGTCSYKILENGRVISEKSSKIEEMQIVIGSGESRYYFYTKGEGPEYIDINMKNGALALVVSYENEFRLNGDDKAFFRLSRDAFK